jgi:sulfide:quinone oxidoreductase
MSAATRLSDEDTASRGTRTRVLVAGAGVAGLEFVLALAELAPGRAAVEIVSPDSVFRYRPFAVAETFGVGAPFRLDMRNMASDAGATWRPGELVSVDHDQHVAFTAQGELLPYDLLVVASGARSEIGLQGALTFRGEQDESAFRALLTELASGVVDSVAFAVPPGASWPLPLYELALMSAAHLEEVARTGVRLVLVTPEAAPLERFDGAASELVAGLLEAAGIEVECGRYAVEPTEDGLRLVPDGYLKVERVVTLPRLRGPHLAGLPCDRDGFLQTDLHGRVRGADDVYAVGDVTSFPVKQGGIAIQQAGAAGEDVAARLGVPLRPTPFRPVLRGLLLTGETPRFLWADPTGGRGETSAVAYHPLWWPPGKIAGGRLAHYLDEAGLPVPPPPAGPTTVPIELELELEAGRRSGSELAPGQRTVRAKQRG